MFKSAVIFLSLLILPLAWANSNPSIEGQEAPISRTDFDPAPHQLEVAPANSPKSTPELNEYAAHFFKNQGKNSRTMAQILELALKGFQLKKEQGQLYKAGKYEEAYDMVPDISRTNFELKEADNLYRRRKGKWTEPYSYGVPTPLAVTTIGNYSPILEIGAGTGYWAKLLKEKGTDIIAFDNRSSTSEKQWFPVEEGDETCIRNHPERNLFLCFPPKRSDFAFNALSTFQGKFLMYIGEEKGGTTANQKFFDLLDQDFTRVKVVPLPNWPDQDGRLIVYQRTSTMTDQERSDSMQIEAPRPFSEFYRSLWDASIKRCKNCYQQLKTNSIACTGCSEETRYCSNECQAYDRFRHQKEDAARLQQLELRAKMPPSAVGGSRTPLPAQLKNAPAPADDREPFREVMTLGDNW